MVLIVWLLDLKLPMQSVPITTKAVSSNPIHCELYPIQYYVCLSVTCDRSVFSSTNKTDHHDITEILLKVSLNTINQTYIYIYIFLVIGTIPGPLLVGWVIDNACLIFIEGSCGNKGNCLLYSHEKMAMGIMIWWLIVSLMSAVFYMIAILFQGYTGTKQSYMIYQKNKY